MGKGNALQTGNYRRLKLTNQTRKIVDKDVKKLLTLQVNINEIQFGFILEHGTTETIFVFRKEGFVFSNWRIGESF